MSAQNLLMVGDSERDANMLYAVGMFVPDAFIYLKLNGKCHVVMSDLEIDRAQQQAPRCRVLSLSQIQKKLRKDGLKKIGFAQVIRQITKDKGINKLTVPEHFPLGLAKELEKLKVRLKVRHGPFFPERQVKSAEEVKKISAALIMAEVGLSEGIQVIRNSKLGKKKQLMHRHIPLTAEKLRSIIDTAILQAGGLANHTIVACGRQGCDPHERGSGVLRANEPIIIDVFPRSQKTGYFGDITRTVVKGKASDALRKLYYTVQRGQEVAFENLQHKASGKEVHDLVQSFFEREGYKTGRSNGRMHGFFHGTGHGLGLEVHESPRVGATSMDTLRSGHVVTVEPGLYYSELGGGVRLEDVALITNNGPRNLTRFEKVLEV